MKRLVPGILLLLFAHGCASTPVSDKSAQKVYEEIEGRLLDSKVLRVDYEVEAAGAFEAKLAGDLVIQKPALAAIRASGSFAGSDVTLMLVSDGKRMHGGIAPEYFEHDLPAELHDGVLVGLLRMGILHNLATLSQGAPPEGTDGRVREWVVAKKFGWHTSTRTANGRELRGISFLIEVGGEPAGDVVLWYDPVSGLPVQREQIVNFDTGSMRVTERYRIETDGMIGPCRFDPDSLASSSK